MNKKQVSIKETLESLGIDKSCQIVISDKPDIVEQTAAKELKDFLKGKYFDINIFSENDASTSKRFLLGTIKSLNAIRCLSDRRELKIKDISEKDDGYHLKRIEKDVVIAGANSRGVLYGTYRLIDWIKGDREEAQLDIYEKPYFRERWVRSTLYGRSDNQSNLKYLAKMGVNTTNLQSGLGAPRKKDIVQGRLISIVSENKYLPQISELSPPSQELVNMMDKAHEFSCLYGMGNVLWVEEPRIAERIHPDLIKSISEDLITQASLSHEKSLLRTKAFDRKNSKLKYHTLCIFHPKVENHYKSLIKNLLSRYPNLKTILVYNEDGGSSNCYPPSCPRCSKLYPEGYTDYPYLAHTYEVKIMQEAGQELNREFRIATGTWHWFGNCAKCGTIDEADRKNMIDNLPQGSIVCCLNTLDSQVSAYEIPSWSKDIIKKVKERGDLPIFTLDDFNGTCEDLLTELTAGFPIPYRTYKKMHNWAKAGVTDGIVAHPLMGPTLKVNSINDIAYRIFSWKPLMSSEEADRKIRHITRLQLGSKKATREMINAYKFVEKSLDVWAEAPLPYIARLYHGLEPLATLPLSMDRLEKIKLTVEDMRVVKLDSSKITIKRVLFWFKSLTSEIQFLEEALMHAKRAAELAPDDKYPLLLWYDEDTPRTCSDYAEVQVETIEIVMRIKTSFAHFLKAGMEGEKGLRKVAKKELDNTKDLIKILKVHRKWIQAPIGHEKLDSLLLALRDKKKHMEKDEGDSQSVFAMS